MYRWLILNLWTSSQSASSTINSMGMKIAATNIHQSIDIQCCGCRGEVVDKTTMPSDRMNWMRLRDMCAPVIRFGPE